MKKGFALFLCLLTLFSAFGGLTTFAQDSENETQSPTQAQEEALPEVPAVRIVTNDNVGLSLKKADGYVDATVTITDTDGTELTGTAQVKVRGNSTSGPAKKPYTVKFTSKQDVLGMGKAKKWALLANMFDPTLLRNYIGINTAAEMALPYTSMQRVVEVWMDGKFRGCYNLIEPVQEGKTRVDIDIESNDGMKDFLIEREYNRVEADATYFKTNGIRFVCGEPEAPTDEQLAYIQRTMDDVIATLKSGDRAAIEKKIDVDSFVKYYVMNEFIKPVDFDYSSVFFYYKDGKLYAGPAWDYDLSMGNEDPYCEKYITGAKTEDVYCAGMHLYKYLSGYDWFFTKVRATYQQYQPYFESIGADGGLADTLAETYAGPIERNFSSSGAAWHTYAYFPAFNRRPSHIYTENLATLKSWCNDRGAWLNGYFTEGLSSYIIGDADSDDELSVMDATIIQRTIASIPETKFDRIAADADCDSGVTIFDATCIQMQIADLRMTYVGERIWQKTK